MPSLTPEDPTTSITPLPNSQALESTPCPRIFLIHLSNSILKAWPPVPFVVPVLSQPGATLRLTQARDTGTPTDTEETLDLLAQEINILLALAQPGGPQAITVYTKSENIYFRCWATTRKLMSIWTHELALATLRTIKAFHW